MITTKQPSAVNLRFVAYNARPYHLAHYHLFWQPAKVAAIGAFGWVVAKQKYLVVLHAVHTLYFLAAIVAHHNNVARFVTQANGNNKALSRKRRQHTITHYPPDQQHSLNFLGFPKNLGNFLDLVDELLPLFSFQMVLALAGLL